MNNLDWINTQPTTYSDIKKLMQKLLEIQAEIAIIKKEVMKHE